MQTKKGQKGFSLIELLIVVAIIGIIAAIAIPNLLASRKAANESAAIGTMRTIGSAQATYLSTVGGNTTYAGSLPDLLTEGLIDNVLGTAPHTKSGYTFDVSAPGAGQYTSSAAPAGNGGTRSFTSDESGVILDGNGQAIQ